MGDDSKAARSIRSEAEAAALDALLDRLAKMMADELLREIAAEQRAERVEPEPLDRDDD